MTQEEMYMNMYLGHSQKVQSIIRFIKKNQEQIIDDTGFLGGIEYYMPISEYCVERSLVTNTLSNLKQRKSDMPINKLNESLKLLGIQLKYFRNEDTFFILVIDKKELEKYLSLNI